MSWHQKSSQQDYYDHPIRNGETPKVAPSTVFLSGHYQGRAERWISIIYSWWTRAKWNSAAVTILIGQFYLMGNNCSTTNCQLSQLTIEMVSFLKFYRMKDEEMKLRSQVCWITTKFGEKLLILFLRLIFQRFHSYYQFELLKQRSQHDIPHFNMLWRCLE